MASVNGVRESRGYGVHIHPEGRPLKGQKFCELVDSPLARAVCGAPGYGHRAGLRRYIYDLAAFCAIITFPTA